MRIIAALLMLGQLSMSFAEPLTHEMKSFMRLAAAKNGDQYGFTKDDAQQYLGITWGKSPRRGAIYESTQHLTNDVDQPTFEYSANRGTRILTLYFTEPVKPFVKAIERLRGFEAAWFPRQQANGLPIHYFEGKNPSEFIPTRKLWIRIYECADKPQTPCIRRAQLIFAKPGAVF